MRTYSAHTRAYATLPARPVARLTCLSNPPILGNRVQWDGDSSSGEGLTYAWEVTARPHGSTQVLVASGASAHVVLDRIGAWRVRLTVRDLVGQEDSAEQEIRVQGLLRPPGEVVTPDGAWGYDIAGTFFREYVASGALPVVWSGLVQILGAIMLRAWSAERMRTLGRVQEGQVGAWVPFRTRTALPVRAVWGAATQSGVDALTSMPVTLLRVVAISAMEVVVTYGSVSEALVGRTLTIPSGVGAGDYGLQRLNADGSGYLLDPGTHLDAAPRATGTLLRSLRGDTTLTDLSPGADWAARGAEPGDLIRISTGAVGLYAVQEVLSAVDVRVFPAPPTTRAGCAWELLPGLRARINAPTGEPTSVVYVPYGSFDPARVMAADMTGDADVVSPHELRVRGAHVFEGNIGGYIDVRPRGGAAVRAPITGVLSTRDGYTTTQALPGPYPRRVGYTLRPPTASAERVVSVDGSSYRLLSVREVRDLPGPEEGGPGACWALDLADASLAWGREGLSWDVSPQVILEAGVDARTMGVRTGDVLLFRVRRPQTGREATIAGEVVGALGDRVSFRVGIGGALSGAEVAVALRDLGVDRAVLGADGRVVFTGLAEEVAGVLLSAAFRHYLRVVPLIPGVPVSLGSVDVQLVGVDVIRRTAIPVDDTVLAVPALREWVTEPEPHLDAGRYVLVAADGTSRAVQQLPRTLYAGDHYHISPQDRPLGQVTYAAGADTVYLDAGIGLANHGALPGDLVSIHTGLTRGTWRITTVLQDALRLADFVPPYTGSGRAVLSRPYRGSFLQIHPGVFGSGRPADVLWAPAVVQSTQGHVANSWGEMVGLRPETLRPEVWDAPSYLDAVRSLAWAQTRGPTPQRLEYALAALLGQPVHPYPVRILSLDTASGGLVCAQLTDRLQPTGLHRVWSVATRETVEPLFGVVGENPTTRTPWAVGDIVPAWTPLTRRVRVLDEGTAPGWWRVSGASPLAALRRYHGFEVAVDARAVPPEVLDLVDTAVRRGSPVWTMPVVVAVLPVEDALEVDESLSVATTINSTDHPALSVEAGADLDDVVGSSVDAARWDAGGFLAARTLYRGEDLTWDGSAFVSARGGFTGVPTRDISSRIARPMVVAEPTTGPWVGNESGLPRDLVLAGDVLLVEDGYNAGWYRIVDVTEGRLTVDVDGDLPDAPPAASRVRGVAAHFQVLRQEQALRWAGTVTVAEDSREVDATGANLVWDGAAVGDAVIVTSGPNRGVYTLQSLNLDGQGFTTTQTFLADGEVPIRIVREALRPNPLVAGDDLSTDGTDVVLSASAAFDLAMLRRGDTLRLLDGADAGLEFRVIAAVSDTQLLLDAAPPSTASGVSFEIVRETRSTPPLGGSDEDERAWFDEPAEVCVLAPRTLLYTSSLLDVSPTTATVTTDGTIGGGIDLSFLALHLGDSIDLGAPTVGLTPISGTFDDGEEVVGQTSGASARMTSDGTNYHLHYASGTFVAGEVLEGLDSGATAEVGSLTWVSGYGSQVLADAGGAAVAWEAAIPATPGWPTPGSIWRSDTWVISGDTATAPASVPDLQAAGVRPGDWLRTFSGDSWQVLVVAGVTLVLAQDTGLTVTPVPARVWRSL